MFQKYVRLEVFMVVKIQVKIFWVVKLCSVADNLAAYIFGVEYMS